ncbi:MAG: hypothetical protein Q8P41_26805 [Pseudomonadota bacterium]|nr:hypothetical protein [Pseudomonadota bacterium]
MPWGKAARRSSSTASRAGRFGRVVIFDVLTLSERYQRITGLREDSVATNPVVHLTFVDPVGRRFASTVSVTGTDDNRYVQRCEASGVHYNQGSEDEAKRREANLVREGYTRASHPDVVLGPEPLRRR